jgi:hypothetical protein
MKFYCEMRTRDTLEVKREETTTLIEVSVSEREAESAIYVTPATARKIAAELIRLADEMEGK